MGPWGTEETWGKHYLIWLGLGPGWRTWPKLRLGLASEEARMKETRRKGRRSLEAAILLTLVSSLNQLCIRVRDFDLRETSSCNAACWSSTDFSTYLHPPAQIQKPREKLSGPNIWVQYMGLTGVKLPVPKFSQPKLSFYHVYLFKFCKFFFWQSCTA